MGRGALSRCVGVVGVVVVVVVVVVVDVVLLVPFVGYLPELRDARWRELTFEVCRWRNVKRCGMEICCHMQPKNRVDVRCILRPLLPAD